MDDDDAGAEAAAHVNAGAETAMLTSTTGADAAGCNANAELENGEATIGVAGQVNARVPQASYAKSAISHVDCTGIRMELRSRNK